MPLRITSGVRRTITLDTDANTLLSLLEDLPGAARLFPRLERMTNLGHNIWRWDMEGIGLGHITFLKLSFSCRYRIDRDNREITWEPLDRNDRATIEGRMKITPRNHGCILEMDSTGSGKLPLPSAIEPLLTPLVKLEAEYLIDRFLENITKTLSPD